LSPPNTPTFGIANVCEAAIKPSVGSRGDSDDNALAETIDRLCKTEQIHQRTQWKTRESVELATLEWLVWFNIIDRRNRSTIAARRRRR
jgi:transposase InsO family protein